MQISSASNPMSYPSAAAGAATGGVQAKWSQAPAANADDADDTDGTEEAAPAHGASAASQGGGGGPSTIVSLSDAATAGNDSDPDTPGDAQELAGTDATGTAVGATQTVDGSDAIDGDGDSPVKSLTYGALGLESPAEQQIDNDSFYTAGRWLAAAVTIGGLISLFA